MIGEKITGEGYTVKSKIGEGGMGVVYLAENEIGLKVAVKVLKPDFAGDAGICRRFRRECEAMVRLQGHPNIVQIHSFVDYNGTPMLVMEYLEGGMDLNDYLEKRGAVKDEVLLKKWLIQILQALDYAHHLSPKIIHRDIKPSNLYLTRFGDIKLLDFGIVKVIEESTDPNVTLKTLTSVTSKLGSLNFMSPEQSFDSKLVDERSDIYSLGKTLKALMTAGNPFIEIADGLLKTIIETCTVDHPDKRFQSCKEILQLFDKSPETVFPEEKSGHRPVESVVPEGMVLVEGGTFRMGNSDNGYSDERPSHAVTLSSYYIGRFPVTQKLWKEVMGSNPSCFKGDDLPVDQVSWFDCVKFCNTLSWKSGFEACYRIEGENVTLLAGKRGYRLPTEAEWEYAARGGRKSKGYRYAGSNDPNSVALSHTKTYPVGKAIPNELGIYDMTGNVWEWCWDGYDNYSGSPQINPTGPVASVAFRVQRGGWWSRVCRITARMRAKPDTSDKQFGFRLVLPLE